MQLTDAQRLDWLRLIRSEGVGPQTFRALVNQYGGAGQALEALPDLARRRGRGSLRIASVPEAERELAAATRLGARFVAMGEPDYPKPLQAIPAAPPLVALRGAATAPLRPTVAIVGSRNASAAGLTFTARLARDLGEGGLTIASGLARGIDTAAHKASLKTGTVAVLAGGLDRIYPAENAGLLDQIIADGGAALSEMPFGWEPRATDFPRRNRIVSGLSYGVVVVEAARRSGSLITARQALEQGREVFAVPGSPLDARADGPNDLIRSGATLCTSADDVRAVLGPLFETDPADRFRISEPPADAFDELEPFFEELPFFDEDGAAFEHAPVAAASPAAEPSADEAADPARIIVERLGPSPVSVDDLCRQTGVPIRSVQQVLMELELAGRLERHGGNAVSLLR